MENMCKQCPREVCSTGRQSSSSGDGDRLACKPSGAKLMEFEVREENKKLRIDGKRPALQFEDPGGDPNWMKTARWKWMAKQTVVRSGDAERGVTKELRKIQTSRFCMRC